MKGQKVMESFQKKMIDDLFSKFENDCFKDFGYKLVENLPDYWFEVPASSSGKFHPLFVCGSGGLFLHSYAVATFACFAMELEQYQNKFDSLHRDAIRLGAFIHDGEKHGKEDKGHTIWEHPIVMADTIRSYKGQVDIDDDIIEFMAHIVASHMGQWNENKRNKIVLDKPDCEAGELLHLFDYYASRKIIEVHFEDVAPIEKPTIDTYVFNFGRHNGKSLKQVMEQDPSYIVWAKDNYNKEPLRTLLKQI